MSVPAFEVSPRGRIIYSEVIAERARELYAVPYSKVDIARMVADEFGLASPPTKNTVTGWVDPQLAAQWKATSRARRREDLRRRTVSVVQGTARSLDWKMERVRRLREAGVSATNIAAVMNLDFPGDKPVSRFQMERAVLGRPPRQWRKA